MIDQLKIDSIKLNKKEESKHEDIPA